MFLGVVECGFVAVMAVGDDEFLVGHGCGKQPDGGRIADAPDAVQNTVLVGDLSFSGTVAFVQNLFNAAGGVRIEHEDLAEVGMGGLEQVQAVALGF